jgi:hypothetical protein
MSEKRRKLEVSAIPPTSKKKWLEGEDVRYASPSIAEFC